MTHKKNKHILHTKQTSYKRPTSLGREPGELVDYDIDNTKEAQIFHTSYNTDEFFRKAIDSVDNIKSSLIPNRTNWIQVNGYDIDVIESIGKQFNIHPLVLEDINERVERPKIQSTKEYCFITMNVYIFNEENVKIVQSRFSLLLLEDLLITFHESTSDHFAPVLSRLEQGIGKARQNSSDYLAYQLLDCIIDQIFNTLQILGEKIDSLERDLANFEKDNILALIHKIKHQLIIMRRGIWPLRELFSSLVREGDEQHHFSESCTPFLRDLYDHALQAAEINESLRDETISLLDLYLNSIANNLNQVMKILSIIGTIFLPLTFITSLYGMNFTNMPEINSPYGYPTIIVVMLGIAGFMLYYFKKKKWL